MTKLFVPPLTDNTFEEMVKKWSRVIKFEESASVYYSSKSEIYWRMKQLFSNQKLLEKYFKDISIKIIDIEAIALDDTEDLKDLINLGKKRTAVFVTGANRILIEKNQNLLKSFSYFAENYKVSFLLFFNCDFLHPNFSDIFEGQHLLLQNIIIHRLFNLNDTLQFINYLGSKWSLEISEQVKHKIALSCGGFFWFNKAFIRLIRDDPKLKIDEIYNSEEIQIRLKLTWQKFLPTEKSVFKKIINKNNNFNKEEKHSLFFLIKTGWIKSGSNQCSISIPILEKYVTESMAKQANFEVDRQNRIRLNGVIVDKHFSQNEKEILCYLIKNSKKIIDREKISQIIWKEKYEELASDWAIDQLISRLRKKLNNLETHGLIKTIRGEGFMFKIQNETSNHNN